MITLQGMTNHAAYSRPSIQKAIDALPSHDATQDAVQFSGGKEDRADMVQRRRLAAELLKEKGVTEFEILVSLTNAVDNGQVIRQDLGPEVFETEIDPETIATVKNQQLARWLDIRFDQIVYQFLIQAIARKFSAEQIAELKKTLSAEELQDTLQVALQNATEHLLEGEYNLYSDIKYREPELALAQ